VLAQLFSAHTRAALQALISSGAVCVNGVECRRQAQLVNAGQEINIDFSRLPQVHDENCDAENIPLRVVYEDDDIVVVNKAAGMVIHPGHGNRTGTVQAALLYRHPPAAALPRAGIVHRLDKDTSGLFVAAKTEVARQSLIEQFKSRQAGREYLALVCGAPAATGLINRALSPKRGAQARMNVVHSGGKEAVTRYAVLRRWPGFALLRCWLETGRTHQIRAHLEYAGYPIIGDPVYQRRARCQDFFISRQALHAETLRLIHPVRVDECCWSCPLPDDMQAVIAQLDAVCT
jgi:23S rRNA pseudouridine1911/1915/1917 synthase